jgi:hypothetical protein
MYGVINQAIKIHVIANYGEEKWEAVRQKSAVGIDFTTNDQPYNDQLTFNMAEAVAQEMQLPIDEVLVNFGESVIKTTNEKMSGFMDSRGNNLKEYLINLPNFHNRMMLIYPNLTPPEFQVTHIEENSINLHYISKTKGIRSFVKGYLRGLVHFFDEKVTIEPLQSATDGAYQQVFKISW